MTAKELRLILQRILCPAPGRHVSCASVRRLVRMCGHNATAPSIVVAVQEIFKTSSWVRREGKRAFDGVAIRPGFSVVEVGTFLQARYAESRRKSSDDVVGTWEAQLSEEGLPADHTRIPDPANLRHANEANQAIRAHATKRGRTYQPQEGMGTDLAADRIRRGELALSIPGFFLGRTKNPEREKIWRLAMVEGVRYTVIGKLFKRTPQAIKRVVQQVSERLDRHLRKLGHGAVPPPRIDPKETSLRYLYANYWQNESERLIWEQAVFQLASPRTIADSLHLDVKDVTRILRKHRARAKRPLDEL